MGLDLHPGRKRQGEEGWDYDGIAEAPWPQWSYGGFARFRERLAAEEGFDLREMRGFDGSRDWATVSSPLKPLLNHSDCDGEMTPQECAGVLPRLQEIIAKWAALEDFDPAVDYDISNGRELCQAMEMCARDDLTLLFR